MDDKSDHNLSRAEHNTQTKQGDADEIRVQAVLSAESSIPETESDRVACAEETAQTLLQEDSAALEEATDFRRDLETRGCPVCNRVIQAVFGFLSRWQYLLASDKDTQHAFAAALGFCPLHTWQLAAMASPLGLSQGLPALMERLSSDLLRIATSGGPNQANSVLTLVPGSVHCRVCTLIRAVEETYLKDLGDFVQGPEGRLAYLSSQGLCLPHLGKLITGIPSEALVTLLIEHASRHFATLSEDMRNYARKREALQREAVNEDEGDAHLRGLVHCVGAKRACSPWGSKDSW